MGTNCSPAALGGPEQPVLKSPSFHFCCAAAAAQPVVWFMLLTAVQTQPQQPETSQLLWSELQEGSVASTFPLIVFHCQECEIPGPEHLAWGWWEMWLWFGWSVLRKVGFIASSGMAQKEVLCEITVQFHTYQRVCSFPFKFLFKCKLDIFGKNPDQSVETWCWLFLIYQNGENNELLWFSLLVLNLPGHLFTGPESFASPLRRSWCPFYWHGWLLPANCEVQRCAWTLEWTHTQSAQGEVLLSSQSNISWRNQDSFGQLGIESLWHTFVLSSL